MKQLWSPSRKFKAPLFEATSHALYMWSPNRKFMWLTRVSMSHALKLYLQCDDAEIMVMHGFMVLIMVMMKLTVRTLYPFTESSLAIVLICNLPDFQSFEELFDEKNYSVPYADICSLASCASN